MPTKPANLYAWTDNNVTGNLRTLYTDTTTLSTNMSLYDATGTATRYIVTSITNGNSFDIGTLECTLTVDTVPSDATVTFNTTGTVSGKTITVPTGTTVSYTVSRSSLETQNKTITVNSDTTQTVTLKYPSGTVLFNSSTPGTSTLNLLVPTDVNIITVGGGGGASLYTESTA